MLGAVAGIAAVFAIGEIVAGGAGGSSLIESTLGPLRRARAEGRLPTSDERFRLAASAGLGAVGGGWWFAACTVDGVTDWPRFWWGETALTAAVCIFFALAYRGRAHPAAT